MSPGLPADPKLARERLNLAGRAALPLVLALSLACASGKTSERLAPQTMSPEPATAPRDTAPEPVSASPSAPDALDPREPSGAGTPASSDPAGQTAESTDRGLTVVIDEGETPQDRRRTLVEAAAAERERRKTSAQPIAVLTNENLKDYAQGQMTELEPQPTADLDAPADVEGGDGADSPVEASADPEAYWRGRVLRARMNWASAEAEVAHLDQTIAELRQRFYAEEDPYYRDSRIKPSWDRAIDRLEEARSASERYRKEVQTILEDGRRASALPGWLREGLDLEPDVSGERPTEGPTPPGEYKPGEPQIATDPDGRSR